MSEDLDSPKALLHAYQNEGMVGYIDSPRDRVLFLESQPQGVYAEPNIAGSGNGKRACLWQYLQQVDKGAYTERQTEPDCFVAGTRVRMRDGTERSIEEVVAGDVVASPFGGTRTVLRSFERLYVGELCELRAEGCVDSVIATADHRFVSHVNKSEWVWSEAGALAEGDRVFLPRGDVSSGVRCSDTARKAYKHSKAASELHFYGDSAVAICPSRASLPSRVGGRKSTIWEVGNGFAARIKSYARRAFVGPVYCIEVEGDQAFIANGYAVHNCTSHASRNARDTTRATEILVKGEPEDFYLRGATETTYGARGHGGAGMSPAKAAKFEKDVGFLVRKKYDPVDLSKYNGSIGSRWGRSGVPQEVQSLCNGTRVGTIRQIRSIADAKDALFNGYALMSGQNAAWDSKPTKDHVHRRVSPGWSHAMATVGYSDDKTFWSTPVFFVVNSWAAWNQAPQEWPKDMPAWVPGMIVTTAEDWAVCVESEDCYAYGNVDGFPPQKLPDLGAIGLLNA